MDQITSPQTHLDYWLRRAVLRLAVYLSAVGGDLTAYPFLGSYIEAARQQVPQADTLPDLDRLWAKALTTWDALLPPDLPLPLARLRRAGLGDNHLLALMLTGLVELDARIGSIYAMLHPFPDELHMTVGLLGEMLRVGASGPEETGASGWQIVSELEQRGLVIVHHPERPRAARPISIPDGIWDACTGTLTGWASPLMAYIPAQQCASLDDLRGLLPDDALDRLSRLPELVRRKLSSGVILRGMRGSGRLRALGAVAQMLGCNVLHFRVAEASQIAPLGRLAGPLAVMLNAIPLLDLELAPGEAVRIPALVGWDGLVGVLLNRDGSVVGGMADRCVTLALPAPGFEARARQWSEVLDRSANGNGAVIDELSRSYHLTLGGVERAGKLAQAYAALDGRDHIDMTDVQEACRSLNQRSLENLATRIATVASWDELIIDENTRAELINLILRCRHRETVLASLGRGLRGTTRGVRALFSGPSGTGKTLAARIIAAEMGLDIYRVELSSVVSKYIGETERNLSQLFARAEEQDVILLLDEGDALMTTRTEVRNSTDRYANMETNYLLQRLEDYEGIILITSNSADHIDSAFQRRMDVSIEFSLPDVGQRHQLWYLHLPDEHFVPEGFLRTASLRCALTGGQIRNAALHASVLAMESGEPVGEAYLSEAIAREYTKLGASAPL